MGMSVTTDLANRSTEQEPQHCIQDMIDLAIQKHVVDAMTDETLLPSAQTLMEDLSFHFDSNSEHVRNAVVKLDVRDLSAAGKRIDLANSHQ